VSCTTRLQECGRRQSECEAGFSLLLPLRENADYYRQHGDLGSGTSVRLFSISGRISQAALNLAPSVSRCNSRSGSTNPVKPQLKQTVTFGNAKTPGLSRTSRPEKWIIISVPNCVCFSDPHDAHAITMPPPISLLVFVCNSEAEKPLYTCASRTGVLCQPEKNTFPELFWL
jgi:hypothetical protein